ncbi:MAG: cation diffusion facilitator family transporter [Acidimicrobiales bacterium]|nr:cation diffusion facilitator family transporter [Acidimicrobiales bacterium]MDP6286120.1 cation diffusion facilitator family transporter [Acidimicrobiales bacterium]HJL91795.1 cation diffusion facilitator family transporter [Acidimicrobiales bacterium]HJO41094.1 cation diffusion facilitator family transporter [Acidimicrobiales bacterium]
MATTGKKTILAALIANVGIAIAKFAGFAITKSSTMLAEGIHSSADSANQLLLLLGTRRAKREPSSKHPFGYGRERYFWSFVVALILFSLGSLFAVYEGIEKIRHPHALNNASWAIGILIFGIFIESFSFRTAIVEAKTIKGETSWSKFVVRSKQPEIPVVLLEDAGALFGMVIALGAITLVKTTGEPIWDGIGTLSIGILLGVIAIILAREMHSLIIGEAASETDRLKIVSVIENNKQVVELVEMRTQHLGPEEILIGVRIAFRETLQTKEIAQLINQLENDIRIELDNAGPIFIEPELSEGN